MLKKTIGNIGEDMASAFLRKKKYGILARNYNTRQGEIDIIARKNDKISFVEVKSRTSKTFGSAAEAVTWKKRQHIMQAAIIYLQAERPGYKSYGFDVIEVYLTKEGELEKINHIEDAFTYD